MASEPSAEAAGHRPFGRFEAIGTYVHLDVDEPAALQPAITIARDVLSEVDRTCSRFRDDSDLSIANQRAGRPTTVDPILIGALHAAVQAADDTDGLVEPLLGRRLITLGYDRDFQALRPADAPVPQPIGPPPTWRDLIIDGDRITVPKGASLDLGSIGKAWASDLIAGTITRDLGVGALISVGGDIAIAGDGIDWPIGISEHPDAEFDQVVTIDGGGLATSSTQVRRWTAAGVRRHHIVDPRTGEPAVEIWRTVTATGPTCSAANAASTAAIVLGEDALSWLTERGVDARLVAADGHVVTTGSWPTEQRETTPSPQGVVL